MDFACFQGIFKSYMTPILNQDTLLPSPMTVIQHLLRALFEELAIRWGPLTFVKTEIKTG